MEELLAHGGEVQKGRGKPGARLDGRREKLGGVARLAALDPGQTQAVVRLGIPVRLQRQHGAEAALRRDNFAELQLGGAQPEPARRVVGPELGEGRQLGLRRVGLALFQPQAAEVEMGFHQITVPAERGLIGGGGLVPAARALERHAVVIPRGGIRRHQGRGGFQRPGRPRIVAPIELASALEQGARARRGAAGDQARQRQA